MKLPGFTAEAATYSRAGFFQMTAPEGNKSSGGAVTAAAIWKHFCDPGTIWNCKTENIQNCTCTETPFTYCGCFPTGSGGRQP